jgi:hypothetical protein
MMIFVLLNFTVWSDGSIYYQNTENDCVITIFYTTKTDNNYIGSGTFEKLRRKLVDFAR